ncbi:MAG: succinate dehydrogenase, cytochrome b556 subunit [Chromatiales bacterium]|nr:succinate dehydrogenase, cytochrome b556 subunit [Chromatiales bacterium]
MFDSTDANHSNGRSKPLSPHLTVYKPQLTSILSILHRSTGVALAAGTLLISYWLVATMAGPDYFDSAYALFSSWIGRILLFCWSWAAIYHLSNGIRHLSWDLGIGFSLKATYLSGTVVIVSSLIFTLLLWSIV